MNDVTSRANEPGRLPIFRGLPVFFFLKNPRFLGVFPHLTPKKALFLQLCTTLLTGDFGGAIMALEGRKICSKRKEKTQENDEKKNPRDASLRRDPGKRGGLQYE